MGLVSGEYSWGNHVTSSLFLQRMRREPVAIPVVHRTDWKGIGYLSSIVGALLVGAHSWPKPTDPSWHLPVLAVGVAATIIGFVLRYMAHLKERKEIARAKREAERR
jgi:hypothetical protein